MVWRVFRRCAQVPVDGLRSRIRMPAPFSASGDRHGRPAHVLSNIEWTSKNFAVITVLLHLYALSTHILAPDTIRCIRQHTPPNIPHGAIGTCATRYAAITVCSRKAHWMIICSTAQQLPSWYLRICKQADVRMPSFRAPSVE